MDIKNWIKIFLILVFTLLTIPIILVIINFNDQSFSNEIIDWGGFGDYLSGTIGIVISIANLLLLIILSLYVAKLDTHRHFNEFRYVAYIKLCEKIDNIEDTSKSYTELVQFIQSFKTRNSFAYSKNDFEEIKLKADEVISSIKPIVNILREREKRIYEGSTVELELTEEDKNYFSFLFAESIANSSLSGSDDFNKWEEMSLKRNELLELIQDKMKIN